MLEPYQVTIEHIVIDVIPKKVKALRFSIRPPEGKVKVSVPLRTPQSFVRQAILEKWPWILHHHERLQQPLLATREYQSGEKHYFLGELYTLVVEPTLLRSSVTLSEKEIVLKIQLNSSLLQRERAIYDWYRQQLRSLIAPMIAKWQPKMNVSITTYGIKTMKSRWGSCNIQHRRLWFNTELAKSSRACIESVVVHELVHLLEASHNHRFKALMDRYLPEWRVLKNQFIQG